MRHREIGPVYVPVSGPSFRAPPGQTSPLERAPWADCETPYNKLVMTEVMDDEKYPPPPCGFKPVEHKKATYTWYTPSAMDKYHYYGNGPNEFVRYSLNEGRWLYDIGLKSPIQSPIFDSSFTHDDLFRLSLAWERLQPQIEPKLDILVFLAELDDVVGLAKSLAKKIKDLPAIVGYLKDTVSILKTAAKRPKVRGELVRLVVDKNLTHLADEWLEYNFALKPTAMDLVGILKALFDFNKKLRELKKSAGKLLKTHGGFDDSVDSPVPFEVIGPKCTYCGNCRFSHSNTFDGSTGTVLRMDYTGPLSVKCGITVLYRYSLPPYLEGFEGKFRAFCASIGLRPGLATVWELIPFSFVLDWFVPVGAAISQLRLDPVPVKTQILDICFSKRVEATVLWRGRHWCPLNEPTRSICTGTVSSYTRTVGIEYLTKIPSFRWPSWFQLSLGAALTKGLVKARKKRI